jgi:hypothetical protein
MTIETVQRLYDAQPFRPFSVRLADGRSLRVAHREFLAIEPRGRTVIVSQPNGTVNFVDIMLVTDLELPAIDAPTDD